MRSLRKTIGWVTGRMALTSASLTALTLAAMCGATVSAYGAPLVPGSDSQVVEVLPAARGARAAERQLRQRLAMSAQDAGAAVALAQLYMQQARSLGDARFAGRAMGALTAWREPEKAPSEVLMMVATVQQYLHDFDTAAANLERLLQREPLHPQALLTLATVRRVQGRYAPSDAACQMLQKAGQSLYARACSAENRGLRGETDAARADLQALLAASARNADVQAWLLVSLAELELRSGAVATAEKHFRDSLALASDDYARLGLVDLLLDDARPQQALALTDTMARSDATLVRRAIAAKRAGTPSARADADELRARFDQAAQRQQLQSGATRPARTHARELAMFALWVEDRPALAVELARENTRLQREPIDVLLLARAAMAARQPGVVREAQQIQREVGLHDVRINTIH